MSEYRPGPASLHTRMVYEQALTELPFCDDQDHVDALRGRLAEVLVDPGLARSLALEEPFVGHHQDTHPSLLRISELRGINGLFEVVPGVHQIRGLGPRNITVIDADHGRILIDPPADGDLTATAIGILDQHLGPRPVVARLDGGSGGPPDPTGRARVDGVVVESVPVPDGDTGDMMRWFPDLGLLYGSTSVRHSLPPLVEGGRLRDPLAWSKALHGVLASYEDDIAVVAGAHDWPTWGNAGARQLLADQRDLLRYIHDEVLRLGYQGRSTDEVAALLTLPPSLETRWYAREYDATVEAHVRLLHPRTGPVAAETLPWQRSVRPTAAARFLGWAGGVRSATDRLNRSFYDGDYRWVVEAGELVLEAEPDATGVRTVTAQAYEQLAYQEENLDRRAAFSDRARRLATASPLDPAPATSFCVADADVEQLMDHLAVRTHGPRAAAHPLRFRWHVTDVDTPYLLTLHNGVLFATSGHATDAGTVISTPRAVLADLACDHLDWRVAVRDGRARVNGDPAVLDRFFGLLDRWQCPRRDDRPFPTDRRQRQESQ